MKQLFYLASTLVLLLSTTKSHAQLNHFIYLQSENKQPFYVKMDKKILNSTLSGYLIIPKLQDGTYTFSLGFLSAGNNEHDFSCAVSKDAGYLVKKFGDKGWGLFNLQTLEIVMSGAKEQPLVKENKTDAFSNLLSDVVNDPTIKQENKVEVKAKDSSSDLAVVPETKNEEPKLASTADSIKIDTAKTAGKPALANNIFISTIIKKETIKTEEGLRITYVDLINGGKDTITILIPVEKVNDRQNSQVIDSAKSEGGTKNIDSTVSIVQPLSSIGKESVQGSDSQLKKEDKKFLDIDMTGTSSGKAENNAVIKDTSNNTGTKPSAETPLMINSNCNTIAGEEDFLKLRKKMAAAKTEEDMINYARKAFKQKCFTTDQIKNLGVLFLKDADRYSFFDVAYPFVSDSRNYKQLEDQLTDNYYKIRFQAMIRH